MPYYRGLVSCLIRSEMSQKGSNIFNENDIIRRPIDFDGITSIEGHS